MFSDNCIGVIPDKSRVGLKYAYYSIGIIDYLYSGRIIGRVPNILIRTLDCAIAMYAFYSESLVLTQFFCSLLLIASSASILCLRLTTKYQQFGRRFL